MPNRSAIIETLSLTKRYGSLAALDECTLAVHAGEVFGLLGPNGAGKTTLLRLLLGYLKPTSGRATIAGRDAFRDSVAVHAGVSYLPGDVRLARNMNGRETLTFFAGLRGERESTRGVTLADRLGLDLSRRVSQMSTGMRQKLALAATLAADVPLVILDEPTSNLDPTIRSTVTNMIREAGAAGRTVVFSSHVLTEVEHACDRVAILRGGQLVHDQVMSTIRRGHRIQVCLTGPWAGPPPAIESNLTISRSADGMISIDAPGELAPLLGWLAALPLADLRIEPIGLAAVYEQYHPAEAAAWFAR